MKCSMTFDGLSRRRCTFLSKTTQYRRRVGSGQLRSKNQYAHLRFSTSSDVSWGLQSKMVSAKSRQSLTKRLKKIRDSGAFFGDRIYTTPPLERKIATDSLTPSAPVVCKVSGSMGRGFVYTTGAEAENSAVNSSKAPLY